MTTNLAPAAALAEVPAMAFVAACFPAIDRHSHSARDTLYAVCP